MTTAEKMVAFAVIIAAALFTLWSFTGITPQALGAKPPTNPGSPGDDCSRGNSNQECRDDPSENGKDCEDHGKARGNEDHCDEATPPGDVLVEVCRNGDPHVFVLAPATGDGTCTKTPEEPGCQKDCDQTSTPTEPSTPPTEGQTTTPSTPDEQKPTVDSPTLEDDLEEQAQNNGAPSGPTTGQSAGSPGASATTLPYTGLPLGGWVALGLGAVGSGLYLRRRYSA